MQILSLSGFPAKEHRKVLFGVISLMFSVLQAVFCKVKQIRPLYVNYMTMSVHIAMCNFGSNLFYILLNDVKGGCTIASQSMTGKREAAKVRRTRFGWLDNHKYRLAHSDVQSLHI